MKKINLSLANYTYNLPQDRIATYGLDERDHSKLLYYKNNIQHFNFYDLPELLPGNSTLFFNNTKVIQARLILKRDTGASIEVFLLNPVNAQEEIFTTLESTKPVVYHCMIGNLKKWQEGEVLTEHLVIDNNAVSLKTELLNKNKKVVKFSWDNQKINFSSILEAVGHTPLPPYLNRPDEENDRLRYQTVYSKNPGAVAAPTAGLHFTPEIITEIEQKGIKTDYLTLHVSAGTFQPIKVDEITEHPMHREQIIITRTNLENLIDAKRVVAVGTTAMRTLESTYWYGVKLLQDPKAEFHIDKLMPYEIDGQPPERKEAFEAILDMMLNRNLTRIIGETEIFIFPGYRFCVCDGLLTNFHQPGSTLILLVAAFIGKNWKKVYDEALKNDYRFLSYGDSSLLLK